LGDITGDDATIDLGDIFTVEGGKEVDNNLEEITGYTNKFNIARQKLIDYLNDPKNTEASNLFKNTKLSLGGQQ